VTRFFKRIVHHEWHNVVELDYPLGIAANEHRRGMYSIGAVARMLGLERATIRNWEHRYELVRPDRSEGGQRLFSREDVERLRFVVAHLEAGASPAQAHGLLHDCLQAGRPLRVEHDEAPSVLILLAERDPLAAQLSEFFLRTEGYEVVCTFTPDDAVARHAEREAQVAIVDLLIAGDGYRLCERLKDLGVSVLALSTLATRDAALAAGADAFLRKPIDPLRLVSSVRDLLGTSALVRDRTAVRG
jgi:DNA-binding transcriptional MerR regulator